MNHNKNLGLGFVKKAQSDPWGTYLSIGEKINHVLSSVEEASGYMCYDESTDLCVCIVEVNGKNTK